MNGRETIFVEELVEKVTESSGLSAEFMEEKLNQLLNPNHEGEININDLRRAAMGLLDSLFSDDEGGH